MLWWTTDWQPSSSTIAPTRRAPATIRGTSETAPVTLDMWVSATTLVRGPSRAS